MKSYCVKNDSISYPSRLKNLPGMPVSLYIKGSLPDERKKSVAIVGARKCSSYGRQAAYMFAKILAENEIQIISGLAFGIDSYAHKGCLEGGGKTFAVLGCGIDLCYPKSNSRLYNDILKTGGGILSEYEGDSPPYAYHFPIRNRIISALADAVIIIEARVKSGSLITASYALDQGVPLYCVPGRIFDSLSSGTNALIADGAIPALSPETILYDFGLIGQKKEEALPPHLNSDLSDFEKNIFKFLLSDPKTLDNICELTGSDTITVSEALLMLELNGHIYQPSPGLYSPAYR